MRQIYRAIEATNTKTRRLAYLSAIILILRNDALTERTLLKKLNTWSSENKFALEDYWVDTGEITSTHKNSAGMRYIDLCKKLGLITTIAGMYRVTRMGILLLTLLRKREIISTPFFLTQEEILLYTYLILNQDADFFLTIAGLIMRKQSITLSKLQKGFYNEFLERLDAKAIVLEEDLYRRKILEKRKSITSEWKKPERYVEHIVPPRINWMLDLDLLKVGPFLNYICSFSEKGKILFSHMPKIQKNYIGVSDEWLENDLWYFLKSDGLDIWNLLSYQAQTDAIQDLLDEVFVAFRSSQIPRVPKRQALLFLAIRLLVKKKILASPLELTSWFSNPRIILNKKYEIRLSPRENESYLLLTLT